MAAAQVYIDRAFRLIGVKAQGQAVSAEDNAAAVIALNAMLTRWEADGLSLGFIPVASGSTTLSIPAEHDDTVAYNLAAALAPEYGVEPSSVVVFKAKEGMRALERESIKPVAPEYDLPLSEAVAPYDINSDA